MGYLEHQEEKKKDEKEKEEGVTSQASPDGGERTDGSGSVGPVGKKEALVLNCFSQNQENSEMKLHVRCREMSFTP